jgi:Uma2 family endonuclease
MNRDDTGSPAAYSTCMGGIASQRPRISIQEYYRLERDAVEKSDWYDGEMFNMAGGTTNHSRIKMNLARELGAQLKGASCEPLDSDQRLKIPSTGLRTYPDAAVYCGPIEYDPEDEQSQTATNPTVVFEVLSDSTEAYDRGLKAEGYRGIPSLQAHLLISQRSPHIELFERQNDGSWRFREVHGLDATLRIEAIGVTLSLGELYDRVEFL